MRQAEKNSWNYQNKNPQFVFPVEPSQETSPDQEQDSFMTLPPQTSHPKVSTTTRDVTIQGIRAEAAVVVTEKAVDL